MAATLRRLSFCPYEVYSESPLNSREGESRSGYLIRCEFEDGRVGYADYHPLPFWTGLPAPSAFERAVRKPASDLQFLFSLQAARSDAIARFQKRSLFESLRMPESHFLIQDLRSWSQSVSEGIWQKGFRHLKIKLGRDWLQEQKHLQDIKQGLLTRPFRLRLDFNSSNTVLQWRQRELWLKDEFEDYIEYVEDPLSWNAKEWRRSRLPLAADFEGLDSRENDTEFLTTIVWKPALGIPLTSKQNLSRYKVTHLMDHPLGQCAAVYWALIHRVDSVGGYLRGNLKDSLGFYSELSNDGPEWKPPVGTGWGFDDRLSSLKWRTL